MANMQDFVHEQLGMKEPDNSTTPVSFRCANDVIIKMDLLMKYLNVSTRSKLLTKLVPIALNDAVASMPADMQEQFWADHDSELNDYYEMKGLKEAE